MFEKIDMLASLLTNLILISINNCNDIIRINIYRIIKKRVKICEYEIWRKKKLTSKSN